MKKYVMVCGKSGENMLTLLGDLGIKIRDVRKIDTDGAGIVWCVKVKITDAQIDSMCSYILANNIDCWIM